MCVYYLSLLFNAFPVIYLQNLVFSIILLHEVPVIKIKSQKKNDSRDCLYCSYKNPGVFKARFFLHHKLALNNKYIYKMSYFGGGVQQQQTINPQNIALAEQELEMVTDLFNR